MIHHFDTNVAAEYGIDCAVLLDNIIFWTNLNRANEKNYFDGRYWTYNTVGAFTKIFNYWTTRQVRGVLDKLENKYGLILSGNYNELKYDRTKWYALSNKGIAIAVKCNIHLSDLTNGIVRIDKPIPDTNTDRKPYIEREEKKNPPIVKKVISISEREDIFMNSIGIYQNDYPRAMLKKFFDYWTELNIQKTKMKFELQDTFEIEKRLISWREKEQKWNKTETIQYKNNPNFDKEVDIDEINRQSKNVE